jgi:hypothetical protein
MIDIDDGGDDGTDPVVLVNPVSDPIGAGTPGRGIYRSSGNATRPG